MIEPTNYVQNVTTYYVVAMQQYSDYDLDVAQQPTPPPVPRHARLRRQQNSAAAQLSELHHLLLCVCRHSGGVPRRAATVAIAVTANNRSLLSAANAVVPPPPFNGQLQSGHVIWVPQPIVNGRTDELYECTAYNHASSRQLQIILYHLYTTFNMTKSVPGKTPTTIL